jgi:hypothetical protein
MVAAAIENKAAAAMSNLRSLLCIVSSYQPGLSQPNSFEAHAGGHCLSAELLFRLSKGLRHLTRRFDRIRYQRGCLTARCALLVALMNCLAT